MVCESDDKFISNFHNLEGITMGERRKNLFLLLQKTHQALKAESAEIQFSSLHPKTPLEESFKVEALIYFRKIPDLLEVLKSENPVLIEKVLKSSRWFIKEAFINIDGKQLVNCIFPNLTYNTKLKLLNKLALHLNDVDKANEYFEAIKETYGIYLASKLLPACSDVLILKYLDSNRIEITPKHLLNIIRRSSALTESIFEKLKLHNEEVDLGNKYHLVFVYLIQHNFLLFLTLMRKYKLKPMVGGRATKSIVHAHKQIVVDKAKELGDILKKEQIYKNMKENFKEFYCNLLPRSIKGFQDKFEDYMLFLKRLPSDTEKTKILFTIIRKIYGEESCNDPSFVLPNLIEQMSPEDREIWLQSHLRPDGVDENTWISFMKTDKSVPLLKEKFSNTSVMKQRSELVVCLAKTCKINKDMTALIDVLEFMLQHRNDQNYVHEEFLSELQWLCENQKLKSEHWEIIIKYVGFFKVNYGSFWRCTMILEKYVEYSLKNNLPLKDALLIWMKNYYYQFQICQKQPKFQRKCLILIGDLLSSVFDEDDLKLKYIEYLEAIIIFNRQYKDKISLFINSAAIECLKHNLENDSYTSTEEYIGVQCVLFDYCKSKELNLLEILFNKKECYYQSELVIWLARNHPLEFLNYIEIIMNTLNMSHSLRNVKICGRNYTHLGIPQKVSEICLKILNSENVKTKKCKTAVTILSYAATPNEFLNFVASHSPSELSPDIESEKGKNVYELHKIIPRCFKNIIPASLAVDSMLKFCKGDYLKFTIPSLYSMSRNISENKLPLLLNALSKNAVSVRKHSVLLPLKLLNKMDAYGLLMAVENDNNASIKHTLVKATFSFFVRNPDQQSWDLTQRYIKTVSSDEEIFKIISKVDKIPLQYSSEYFSFIWNILETFTSPSETIIEAKCNILNGVNKTTLQSVGKDIVVAIIQKYLFKSNSPTDFEIAIQRFTSKYLIYCPDENDQKDCMSLFFVTLRKYIETTWRNLINTSVTAHQLVFHFVEQFCMEFLTRKCCNIKTIQIFINMWGDFLKLHETFDTFLYLQLTLLYVDHINNKTTPSQFGKNLTPLCEDLHKKETLVIGIFCDVLKICEKYFLLDDMNNDKVERSLRIIQGILEASDALYCLELAINLLPQFTLMTNEMKLIYENIVNTLKKCDDPRIQVQFHHYLGSNVEDNN